MYRGRNYLLIAGLLLLSITAGCGVSEVSVPPVSPTAASPAGATDIPEQPTVVATALQPTEPVEPATPAIAPETPTQSPDTPPVEQPATTTPAPDEAVASHPLPLDRPWVFAGNRLLVPGGGELELQDDLAEPLPRVLEVAPDGTWAAYSQNGPGWMGLVVRNLGDGTETRIPGQIFSARFSPDSRMITYSTIGQLQNQWSMVIQELPDGEPRVIAESTTDHLLGPLSWTVDGILAEAIIWASDAPLQRLVLLNPEDGTSSVVRDTNHLQARPTRDASRVAFVTGLYMMGGPGEAGIAVLDRATGVEQQIVPQQQGMISSLGWSPDASRLFYVTLAFADMTVTPDALHVLSADGAEDRSIAFDELGLEGTYRDAAWRDDETLLVLTADAGGTLWLYEVAAADFSVTESARWDGAVAGQSDPAALVRVPHP